MKFRTYAEEIDRLNTRFHRDYNQERDNAQYYPLSEKSPMGINLALALQALDNLDTMNGALIVFSKGKRPRGVLTASFMQYLAPKVRIILQDE